MAVLSPKPRQTRLGKRLRELADEIRIDGRDAEALECERAGANLDRAALSLGVSGDRIKTLGSYYVAKGVYQKVKGEPYDG